MAQAAKPTGGRNQLTGASGDGMDGLLTTALTWAAEGESGAAPHQPGLFPPEMIFMFVIIFLLFYLLILRPQRTDQRNRERMIDELAKGDDVVTSGGMHGTVESVDKDKGIVTLNVAPKSNLRFNRSAIASVVGKKHKPKGEKNEKGEEKAG
jgi:preprotein translocase subunit YajC